MFIRLRNQRGFSLIEMMIAMALGLLVTAGIITLFVNTVSTNREAMEYSRLNQEMRAIMELMASDIRRAGYWRDAYCTTSPIVLSDTARINLCGGVAGQNNPFSEVSIGSNINANDCILFSYDFTNDAGGNWASDGTQQLPDELYGYRLNLTGDVGEVERRAAGALCNAGGWQRLSNSAIIDITTLTFTPNLTTYNSGNSVLQARTITIDMTGRIINAPDVSFTLQTTVRLPNHRLCPAAGCASGI